MNFPNLTSLSAIERFKLKLSYEDGTSGVLDVAHLANNESFQFWNEGEAFFQVYIESETGAIAWNEMMDICPNAAYLELRNLTYEQWLAQNLTHATSI